MIWNSEYEKMPRDEIAQLQLERLQATLNRVYRSVSYYRTLFDTLGFVAEDLASLDGLRKLPFTTKDHLREHYPYGMFAVPLREVVRLHTSAGRSGRHVAVGYSANDIKTWSELVARALTAGGVGAEDVVQIAFDYGISTSGFGFHYGAETIGASVIPTSSAKLSRQVDILRDYRSTTLIAPPSVALALAEHLDESGIDPKSLHLRKALLTGERWSEQKRAEIEGRLMLKTCDVYGVSAVIGPGVAGECEHCAGLHVQEDHFHAEVVHPDTGLPVSPGEEGELVLTTITKEAFPLIRFRTGDITRLDPSPCECGRTFVRMSKVLSRTDDMLSFHGVHFYPSQIEDLLYRVEGVHPRFQLVIDHEDGADRIEVLVEVSEKNFFDEMRKQRSLVDEIRKKILEEIEISAKVRFVEARSLTEREGAVPKVVDNRRV